MTEEALTTPADTPATDTPPSPTLEPPASPEPKEASSDGTSLDIADLRAALAGEDEAFSKQLGRYKTVDDMRDGWKNTIQAAKSKSQPLRLADDATDEQKAEFRTVLGLGEKAEEYPVNFREDYEVTDADTEALGAFREAMHTGAADPRTAKLAMEWYQDATLQAKQDLDAAAAAKADEVQKLLRSEWGGEYEPNVAAAQSFMRAELGDEGFTEILETRFSDGTRLQDNVHFVKMMAKLAGDYYGGTGIITGDVETATKTLEQRLEDFGKMRSADPEKYYSAEVQEQVAELYAQRKRLAERR